MSTGVSNDGIRDAIVSFLGDGVLPETEEIVSSHFSKAFGKDVLGHISQVRDEVETELKALSKEAASEIDCWISKAKKLHEEIERSKLDARMIIREHEISQALKSRVFDVEAKVKLLESEIIFNESVTKIFIDVRDIQNQISSVYKALEANESHVALENLQAAKLAVEQAGFSPMSPVSALFSGAFARLQGDIENLVFKQWKNYVQIDEKKGEIAIADDFDIENISELLAKLNKVASLVTYLYSEIYNHFISPIITIGDNNYQLSETNGRIRFFPSIQLNIPDILNGILTLFKFLERKLPSRISSPLAERLVHATIASLISQRLSPAIPEKITDMNNFQRIVDQAIEFSKSVENLGWPMPGSIVSWMQQIPRLWLANRRAQCLATVRARFISISETKQVERVVTQHVKMEPDKYVEVKTGDDWDANWGSEDNKKSKDFEVPESTTNEEDVSAWGLDEDDGTKAAEPIKDKSATTATKTEQHDEDDVDDAWGWGDYMDNNEESADAGNPLLQTNSNREKYNLSREITVNEYYTVSAMPDAILGIIEQQIMDSDFLKSGQNPSLPISSSGPALLALPTLIIAMFKATAPLFYPQKLNGGQMYLYNDSVYLSERLRELVQRCAMIRLSSDIDSLEQFGKSAYSKEMQIQRVILTDMLDGAQGFLSCSEQPMLRECENAIASTIEHLKMVYEKWQPILSSSALLQSIGSLMTTVLGKIITDIEDLNDISAAESQRLAAFCSEFYKLESFFIPEVPSKSDPELLPLTAVYVTNWLKFQYLINILESSLADIKYLWVEGELSLEFSPDEIVDLILALFADSDHRRKTIAEVLRLMKQ